MGPTVEKPPKDILKAVLDGTCRQPVRQTDFVLRTLARRNLSIVDR